jgi:RNase P/RNase MRP subunit p29
MHGVVLRPPARLATSTGALPNPNATPAEPAPARSTSPLKNIEQLMAEADPVHTLRQTGNVRILKPLAHETAQIKGPPETHAKPVPIKSEPSPASAASSPAEPVVPASPSSPASAWTPPPFPAFPPAAVSLPLEVKKAEPVPVQPASVSTGAPPPSEETDSPFILKPAASLASTPKIIPPAPPANPPLMPFGSIFRRKAKMADLARIVLPPKREETQRLHPPSESSPTVVPPAFPVAGAALGIKPEISLSSGAAHGTSAEGTKAEVETPKPSGMEAPSPTPEPIPEPSVPVTDFPEAPKVDPEAHKPEPSAASLPKVDPEAHRPPPKPATPIPTADLSVPSGTPEKREFHLANGERVAGTVLSETPEAVYIDHATLGVLTIPRAQIAKRLVEIILINGDRIVGDIMAETADTLYVRHASLGMLTVPRAQRSTRVVEAILKDGDRILGEVLTETDTFTVIRSATLGTITVPHSKVSMLNRKIEQIELKALPPPAPELKDKPTQA